MYIRLAVIKGDHGCLHAKVLDKSILPAVKIAWLDSSALACSACQRADALAVDAL